MSSGSTNPEAQPLLSPTKPPTYHDEPIRDPSHIAGCHDEESNDTVVAGAPKMRSWLMIVFQSIVMLLSFVVGGLFIKSFIDEGDFEFDLGYALESALRSGLSGAGAMALQVLAFMPLRTVTEFQCRHGTTTMEAVKTLYADGGWTRYYRGLIAALIQGPVSRFGDTAANAGILALLQSNTFMRSLPTPVQTLFASMTSTCFRMLLTPIDTIKAMMETTQGKDGISLAKARVEIYGIASVWYSTLVAAATTFVANYPWFGTYNYLDATLPLPTTLLENLLRSAFIGFAASIASDAVSNSFSIVQTFRQANATRVAYVDSAREAIAVDGVQGLFGRGLKGLKSLITLILANGLQGIAFSMMWKLFMDLWDEKTSRM